VYRVGTLGDSDLDVLAPAIGKPRLDGGGDLRDETLRVLVDFMELDPLLAVGRDWLSDQASHGESVDEIGRFGRIQHPDPYGGCHHPPAVGLGDGVEGRRNTLRPCRALT